MDVIDKLNTIKHVYIFIIIQVEICRDFLPIV